MPRDDQGQRRTTRCAIYTRKSTEEGLDQEFNSLDAQREACATYVLSQRHEGWTLLPDYYDDGGFSGGNMERPGLKRLLADVKAGKIDVIVVYKVDRLTRALSDFSKIIEILDEAGASFVSITQAFNTTTSMGRLTLNVLLSFAQFEREVISERVRDKVAASKRKGIWMGGPVPLGYDVVDRKLMINREEADTVLLIFRRYLELGSVRELLSALAAEGVRTKIQTLRDGTRRGGIVFSRATLYWLLKNPVYIGRVRHLKAVYEGQHEPLVPAELWERVQASLAENGAQRQLGTNAAEPSLLAGRISETDGRPMVASHAKKGPRRYRYYISAPSAQGDNGRALRLPAGEVEALVRQGLTALLSDGGKLVGDLEAADAGPVDLETIARHSLTAAGIADMPVTELRRIIVDLDVRIAIADQRLTATYLPRRLIDPPPSERDQLRLPFSVPGILTRQGHEARLVLVADKQGKRRPNARLVALLVRSFAARRALLAGTMATQVRKAHLCRLARMSYLAPDIVQAILDGTQPSSLTATQMLRTGELPISWAEQRRLFGFPTQS